MQLQPILTAPQGKYAIRFVQHVKKTSDEPVCYKNGETSCVSTFDGKNYHDLKSMD
jgi:hypothetical protein